MLPLKKSSFSVICFKFYAKLIGRFLFRNGNGGRCIAISCERDEKTIVESAFLFPSERVFFIPILISNTSKRTTINMLHDQSYSLE